MNLEPTIGLEVHVQLRTRTKMLCPCELTFGAPPNTRTCPVCLGLPGTLPTVNAEAIHFGLMIGEALGATLAPRSVFHRKNYFYPDLPKGYQISQYDEPLCRGGRLGDVRIHRVHLEEDAAKLIHLGDGGGRIQGADASVVDFNRGGTPLVEIVTEPDLHDAETARGWLQLLAATLRQLGVSDVRMEEGSLRCDANVSMAEAGAEFGTKTELKNMNSFGFLRRGIDAEIERQRALLADGQEVRPQTLHFDPRSGSITALRSKEQAHDYRYFPDPDLVPVAIDDTMRERASAAVGELPAARLRRYETELGLAADHAQRLAFRPELAEFFERVLEAGDGVAPAELAKWTGAVADRLREADPATTGLSPGALVALVRLVQDGRVGAQVARDQVLELLLAGGGEPAAIVAAEGLGAIDDAAGLADAVARAIGAHPAAADRMRAGNAKAVGPIVGHVMRATQGRADGGEVTRLVREQLGV